MKKKLFFHFEDWEKKIIATFSNILEFSWQTNTPQNLNISIFRQKNFENPPQTQNKIQTHKWLITFLSSLSLSLSPFLFSSLIGSGGGVIPWWGDEGVAANIVVVIKLDLSLRWKEMIGLEVRGKERS